MKKCRRHSSRTSKAIYSWWCPTKSQSCQKAYYRNQHPHLVLQRWEFLSTEAEFLIGCSRTRSWTSNSSRFLQFSSFLGVVCWVNTIIFKQDKEMRFQSDLEAQEFNFSPIKGFWNGKRKSKMNLWILIKLEPGLARGLQRGFWNPQVHHFQTLVKQWFCSSVGRALDWSAEGPRYKSQQGRVFFT